MADRELPPDVSRKQIVVPKDLRALTKRRAGQEDMTVSQFLRDVVFPDDWETTYHERSETVYMKVTPEVDEMIDRMTGDGIDKAEVIALYLLTDAVDAEPESVERLVEHVPELLSNCLEDQT